MPKQKGQFARLYIDEQAIFTSSPEISFSQDVAVIDSSVYGGSFDQFEVNTYNGKLDVNAFLETDFRGPGDTVDQLSDKFFREQLIDPVTGLVVTAPALITTILKATPVTGDVALFTQGYGTFQWSIPRDGLTAIRMSMQETGAISHGKVLALFQGSFTAAGGPYFGTEVLLGLAPNFIRAGLHITSFSVAGGTPTLQVEVESDVTGFGAPTSRITFTDTTINDLYHDYETAGAYTIDDFLRYKFTVTGAGTITAGGVIVADTG